MATAATAAAPAAQSTRVKEVRVHPIVLASVVDLHVRRASGMPRVIGAVTGTVNDDGTVVEMTDLFPVTYTENTDEEGTVMLDMELLQLMKKQRKRTAPHESLVGWFSSVADVPATSAVLHMFFAQETTQTSCIMLCVDAASSSFKTYVSDGGEKPESMSVADFFHEVPACMCATDMERTVMDVLCKADAKTQESGKPTIPLDQVYNRDQAFEQLRGLIVAARDCARNADDPKYKDKVPAEVLAELKDVLARMEAVQPADIEKVFTQNVTDVLMMAYVTSLAKSQLSLAHRLRNDLAQHKAEPAAAASPASPAAAPKQARK